MIPLDAAASVVLLEFEQSYGLGFVSATGRIVTSFHVLVDEAAITAHLHDGRKLPVATVSALDVRRDLAVLDVGALDATPARPASHRLADEGSHCFVFGYQAAEKRLAWADVTIASIQVLGPSLTVYRLAGEIPRDASGGPLVGPDGSVLGVLTVADTDEGVVTLGVPWRYVEPLIQQRGVLPVKSLSTVVRRPPKRDVPKHPLSLLEGSTLMGLRATSKVLTGAIRRGAPAYNEGDVQRCFDVYAQTAKQLISARTDCPGVQQALQAGLDRAKTLGDVDHQAWAMRDTFDGLLTVIEKYLLVNGSEMPAPEGTKGPKSSLLN